MHGLALLVAISLLPQDPPASLRDQLLAGSERLRAIASAPREHRFQVLVAEPVVDANGRATLMRRSIGDAGQYFYPASSIKLAAAVATLQHLQDLDARLPVRAVDADWRIGTLFAGDVATDRVPIGRDLRAMLIVSDNAAFNHCYEFVGPYRINAAMWDAGLRTCRVWHRLEEAHTVADNRRTRPVELRAGGAEFPIESRDEQALFAAPATPMPFDNRHFAELDVGTGWVDAKGRHDGAMSFAQKNAISLADLQNLLAAIVRPEIDTGVPGLPTLGVAARAFLVQALGELPRESRDPTYDPASYPDDWTKFVLPGVRRALPGDRARVWDKSGRAYGFTIENAYIEDTVSGRGFFFAAVLYTNPNGVVGDDDYDYDKLADPVFAELGELLTRALLVR